VKTTTLAQHRSVFGYVRVSTKAQEVKRQQTTIPLRHGALPDGLADDPLELFYDHGISAWSGKARPGYEEMYARISAGEASALIIDTSSRLTRKGMREALAIFFHLQDVNTRLFTTQGREYSFDLGGIISLIVDAEQDERYSSTLSHNTRSGKAQKAKDGKWSFGPVPPGYRKTSGGELDGTIDLVLIAQMFVRFLAGDTYRQIGDFLTAQISNEVLDRTKHGRINADFIRLLLKNPVYLGVIPYNGQLYPSTHPAAVTPEAFEQVQHKLERRARENYKPPRSWPFSGIARCATCDRAMQFKPTTKSNGTLYAYIRCTNNHCAEKDKLIVAQSFEASTVSHLAAIAHIVGQRLADDEEWAAAPPDVDLMRTNAKTTLEVAERRLAEMTALVKSRAISTSDPDFLSAVSERDVAETEYERLSGRAKSYREALAELVALIESLADHAPTHPSFERMRLDDVMVSTASGRVLTKHTSEKILEGWIESDFETRRAVIAGALDTIKVGKESIELHYRIGIPTPVAIQPCFRPERSSATTQLREAGWGVGLVTRAPR
jgi:site-specific DNA recombinase